MKFSHVGSSADTLRADLYLARREFRFDGCWSTVNSLCWFSWREGALAGTSATVNMVTFGEDRDIILQNNQIVDRVFWWYAEQEFPTDPFDDLSPIPDQVRVKAMSPLCHTSVSKWALEAGANIGTAEKIERCAKVVGETVYTVTLALNEYFKREWVAPDWNPSDEVLHCVECHGPPTNSGKKRRQRWNQQGHMDCSLCHDDHTA